MRKLPFNQILFFFLAAFVFYSCKSTKTSTGSTQSNTSVAEEVTAIESGPNIKIPRYTTSDAVADLKAGMTYEEVVAKLGVKPYNVFSAQAGGFHVIQYKYKLIDLELAVSDINDYGVEKKARLQYNPVLMDLYVTFGPNGKLESLLTTEGRTNTEGILKVNNVFNIIAKDRMKYSKDSLSSYRSMSTEYLPLIICNDCPGGDETVISPTENVNKPASVLPAPVQEIIEEKEVKPMVPVQAEPAAPPSKLELLKKKIKKRR
jgi:hypothetical protein